VGGYFCERRGAAMVEMDKSKDKSKIIRMCGIEPESIVDGPGFRYVLFVQGCPHHCHGCHNPESWPFDAGYDMTVNEVFEDICGRPWLRGVTFSGGECLLYPQFIAEIAKICKDHKIHTAVESAFFVPWENAEKVLPFINLFFADLKIADPKKHCEFTGQDNRRIIDNITRLSKIHNNIILRIPVIPGVNDSGDDIDEFAKIIKTFGKGIKGIELLKYNNLAESKYNIAGKDYTNFADRSQTDGEMEKICLSLKEKCNINCYFV
jgi:pyruvate formate lyase activating enzyme